MMNWANSRRVPSTPSMGKAPKKIHKKPAIFYGDGQSEYQNGIISIGGAKRRERLPVPIVGGD